MTTATNGFGVSNYVRNMHEIT